MTSNPHSDWFFQGDNKEEIIKRIRSSIPILTRTREMVKRKLDVVTSQEDGNTDQYKNTDWAYRQAHINGQKNILKWLDQVLGSVTDKD